MLGVYKECHQRGSSAVRTFLDVDLYGSASKGGLKTEGHVGCALSEIVEGLPIPAHIERVRDVAVAALLGLMPDGNNPNSFVLARVKSPGKVIARVCYPENYPETYISKIDPLEHDTPQYIDYVMRVFGVTVQKS